MAKAVDLGEIVVSCAKCSYQKQIVFEDAKSYLEVACSQCGTSPLLTQQDYNLLVQLKEATDELNNLIGEVDDEGAKYESVLVGSDGMGGVSVINSDNETKH